MASGLALAETRAQSQSPPEPLPDLRALKAGLRKNVLIAILPDMRFQRDQLLALEQKKAAAQDFAGAARARDERAKIEQQIAEILQEVALLSARPAVSNAARRAARIELKLSDAKLNGAELDAADGAIIGWSKPDAGATWKLPDLPPGGYEVLLRCTGPVGEVIVKESFYTLTAACKSADDKSVEHNLGTLRVRDGTGSVTLGTLQPEKASGWRVYSVVLVPSSI